jgi:hypothetical protein
MACAVALAAALCALGCRREEAPRVKTPAQVRAEIAKTEQDTTMPPKVKGMVLGLLRQELARAEKVAKDRK